MKKIMLLSAGGTIACTETAQGLVPTLSAQDVMAHVPLPADFCALHAKTLFNLDSSNIQPEEWQAIATEVHQSLGQYDAVVVLHGTDTMAYTASMLAFMLPNLTKPVILTGAQLPVGHPQTDAVRNLRDTLLAAGCAPAGVYIVFDGCIINGVRAAKVRTTSNRAFESINAPLAGRVKDGQAFFTEAATPPTGQTSLDTSIDPDVFLLKLIPGTRPDVLQALAEIGYRGVVIEGFGLGGIHCVRRNMLEGIQALTQRGVTVLLTTQCRYEPSDPTVYEPGRLAVNSGIIQGHDMTSECAVTKLMWVLGHTGEAGQVRRMMLHNYCGEIDSGAV